MNRAHPRRLWKRLLVALTVAASLGSIGAMAQGCGRHREHNPEKAYKFISWRVNDLLDEVDASDPQRVTINATKDRLFDAALTLRTNGVDHRDAILKQLLSDAPDPAELHRRVDQLAEELRIFGHLAVDETMTIHKTLDAKQRATITEMISDRFGD
jgi:hypothetical protein